MLNNKRIRDVVIQTVVLTVFLGFIAVFAIVGIRNVQALGMSYGWGFLWRETGIALTSTWPFEQSVKATYLEFILIGTANTIRLALIVIVFSVLIGVPVGAARLSKGPAAVAASIYIHAVRGPSLLLHVMFWYAVTRTFGLPRAVYQEGDWFILSNRGVYLPALSSDAARVALIVFALCMLLVVLARVALRKWLSEHPHRMLDFIFAAGTGTLLAVIAAVGVLHGREAIDLPAAAGFRVAGGMAVSPEFFAFSVAAIIYIANYVAEIVRQGVQSIDKGLTEAARALALKPWQVFLLVQMPLAMRNMLPPFTNLMTFIIKSTAAATAVGYSELFTVTSLSINHTGHVLELLLIMCGIYLVINTAVTFGMNLLNEKMKIASR